MITELRRYSVSVAVLLLATALPAAELRLTEGTNITADVAAGDGRILMDLLGSVWIVPARGGDATRLVDAQWQASRPRWSPDGTEVLFESGVGGRSLWRTTLADPSPERITPAGHSEQHGVWHPSGDRITFAAARHASGLDLWERDLASGLSWRLTDHAGDETEPAWSRDGRHLVYVLHERDRWYLMLRRFGHPPAVLQASAMPLRSPAWRPDNTLITFLARNDDGAFELTMLIPSVPPLTRTLISREDFFLAPVAWLDRERFFYTADGQIKTRYFGERRSRTLPFSAAVGQQREWHGRVETARPLPDAGGTDDSGGDLIIRASRLFDGDSAEYRVEVDVVIENGIISAIEPQRDRGDAQVIDIAGSTLMPGLIDAYGALPGNADRFGPLLLAYGVTTIVTPDLTIEQSDNLARANESAAPRFLLAAVAGQHPVRDDGRIRIVTAGAATAQPDAAIAGWRKLGLPLLVSNWNAGLIYGADMLLGTATLPVSPAGQRYRDVQGLTDGSALLLVSGLADNNTPGLASLQTAPQAQRIALAGLAARHPGSGADWLNGGSRVIVGSRPSGFAPGFATQAELLALHAAGLGAQETLAAATSAAADALGLAAEIGRVRVGLRADLLLVAGDPLRNPADIGKPIAVVRNGRFYSTGSLLDEYARRSVE